MNDPQKFKLAFEKMSASLGYEPDQYLQNLQSYQSVTKDLAYLMFVQAVLLNGVLENVKIDKS